MSIAVTCPTRRPDEFKRMVGTIQASAPSVTVLAYTDDCDPEREPIEGVRFHRGTKLGPCRSVNRLVEVFPEYDIYGVCPDDAGFTPGQDWAPFVEQVFSEFPKGIGVLSPAHRLGPFVNFPFVSKRWIDTLGWFAFPPMYHFCWDTVLEALGELTNIRFAQREEMFMDNWALPAFNHETHFAPDCEQFLWWWVQTRKPLAEKLKAAMG